MKEICICGFFIITCTQRRGGVGEILYKYHFNHNDRMKKVLYILFFCLCCNVLSYAQDSKESIILKVKGKPLGEIVLSIHAEGEVSIDGVVSTKIDEQGRYVCVLPEGENPEEPIEGVLTLSASRFLGLTLDEMFPIGIDLSRSPSLTYLDCGKEGGAIRELNLSALEDLVYLDCSKQELSLLNLEGRGKLETLRCSENNLAELKLQQIKELKQLECAKNQLTELILNNLDKLELVRAEDNKISSIKLEGLISLKEFQIRGNPLGGTLKIDLPRLETLDVSFCGLEAIDLSKAPNLLTLSCSDNKLSSLNIANSPNLVVINCYHNKINGKEMGKMIAELPDYDTPANPGHGKCYALACGLSVEDPDELEENFAYEDDIEKAGAKQWAFFAKTKDGRDIPYAGQPLSIDQMPYACGNISVSPNPARDCVSVGGAIPCATVYILDFSGRRLVEAQCNDEGALRLEVRALPIGNYLIVIDGNTHKLTIAR